MIVYNQEKTQILESYDLSLGYLVDDTITTHIDAVEGVEEQGHYVTIAEYPNGGKEVEWVVDVPRVDAVQEQDIVENIKVFIPYTQDELRKKECEIRIAELKFLLRESDYRAIKYAEGYYTEEQYAPYKTQRQAYRDEINQLEMELALLN